MILYAGIDYLAEHQTNKLHISWIDVLALRLQLVCCAHLALFGDGA
jgi:hypothetical protein